MTEDPLNAPHFARVLPIVGPSLREVRLALSGLPCAAPLITYLAASGVRRWICDASDTEFIASLKGKLVAHHGPALDLDLSLPSERSWLEDVVQDPPHLVIAAGERADLQQALTAAAVAGVPALLVLPPAGPRPCQAVTWFPGDDVRSVTRLATSCEPDRALNPWAWTTALPLSAGLARGMLLRDTPYQRVDLERLWAAGARVLTLERRDPLDVHWGPLEQRWAAPLDGAGDAPPFRTPVARRGTLLIAGLGSLGSVAATHLAPYVARLVIADPERVDAYNPVRQAYTVADIGRWKARALRECLLVAGVPEVTASHQPLTDELQVAVLIEAHQVDAGLVVTGTAADFAIARALRRHNLPHVVGRCYPRARYWEAILVDGRDGPSMGDFRGHLHLGPAPPPTPEQRAIYSDETALEAEAATLVESGWAAAWMARLTVQLMAPPGLRERWLLELLAAQRLCLIGGVGVEPTERGPAYGIDLPGRINAWGRERLGQG
jgi:hypothetical protein